MNKAIGIVFLESSIEDQVRTETEVRNLLEPYVKANKISHCNIPKYSYSQADKDLRARATVKLEECGEKFLGAFISWFGYSTSSVREIEPGTYQFPIRTFSSLLGELASLTCMIHRIRGIADSHTGFEGKVFLKISDFAPSPFTKDNNNWELEPLPKHAKYFNKFAELNVYDF